MVANQDGVDTPMSKVTICVVDDVHIEQSEESVRVEKVSQTRAAASFGIISK